MVTMPVTHTAGRARLATFGCASETTDPATTGTAMWQNGFGNLGATKPSIGGSARHLATGTT